MKKGNVTYLWFIVIIFILLWIPYFQNIGVQTGAIAFFNSEWTFVGIYPIMLFLGVLEGCLIVLYVKSLIDDIKKQEPQKFNL
ncbi:hypothetical protein P148_SR1C00001G0494 [candidate division SR1 bacterium RAAC1_SR1_1]|nr:hypothetical protein P148_SR1C00001G0494 [candidate division SR1 bacterium RAAC1_SR1_1]